MNRMQIHNYVAAGIAAACLLVLPARAFSADGTFDKTLSVHGSVTLSVSTGSGYIHISPGSDDQVHIIGHVRANHGSLSFSSPEERVKQVVDHPPIEQTGNIIRIGKDDHWIKNVSIDYDITTPHETQLTANTGSGDIRVQSVGLNAKLSTGSGNISASGLRGTLTLETGSGDIETQQLEVADVKAETGSGSMHLNGVQGSLRANTGSGDIEIAGKPTSDWKLETGSGSITISANGTPFTLDASTGSGSIKSDAPLVVQGSLDRHHVTGKINGGGPMVRAETGSGSIRVH